MKAPLCRGLARRDFLKGLASTAMLTSCIGIPKAMASTASPSKVKSGTLAGELMAHPQITAAPGSERYWNQVRKAFPLSNNYIHMNTGTTGTQPAFSLNNLAVYNLYKSQDPRDWQSTLNTEYPELFPIIGSSAIAIRQARVATAYGANSDEIVLSYNTTDACNLLFAGIPWNPSDRIITTSFEHPALAGPIAWARDYRDVEVAVIDIPSNFMASITVDEVLSWFQAELTKPLAGSKQYIAFSEIFYKNGLRMPVKAICQLAKSYGAYTIVDTAHGWGHIPINCHDYEADFIAGAGHKWLCGGPGTGILYVRNSGADLPSFNLGNWFLYGNLFQSPSIRYNNRNWAPSSLMQSRGETNTPALYAMTDSLSFFTYIGLHNIYDRGVTLGNYLKAKIAKCWGVSALWVQQNPDPAFATALTCFNPFKAKDDGSQFSAMNTAINSILSGLAAESPKVYIRSVTWRDKKTDPADNRIGFRISTHAMYNNYKEVDYMFERLVFQINKTGLPQLS